MPGNNMVELPKGTITLDTPDKIEAWILLSRMHQLAMEVRIPTMRHSRGPIVKALYHEGFIDEDHRGTLTWKAQVLYALIQKYREHKPDFESSIMDKALAPFDEAVLKKGKVTVNFPRKTA